MLEIRKKARIERKEENNKHLIKESKFLNSRIL